MCRISQSGGPGVSILSPVVDANWETCMSTILNLLKTLSVTTLAGAIGAGLIVFALESGEIDGAASGKKLGKKKNQAPVWEEIGRELMPTPAPSAPPAAVPPTNIEAPNGIPTIENPEEPILDPRNPEQCARGIRRVNRPISDLVIMRGEVRSYYQDPVSQDIACEVEIYPKGCDETYRFVVAGAPEGQSTLGSESRARLCTSLGQAYFHGKSIYVQGLAIVIGGVPVGQLLERVAFTARSMDDFVAYYTAAEAREASEAARRDTAAIARTIDRMFGR